VFAAPCQRSVSTPDCGLISMMAPGLLVVWPVMGLKKLDDPIVA
jgi:hypothetical protein